MKRKTNDGRNRLPEQRDIKKKREDGEVEQVDEQENEQKEDDKNEQEEKTENEQKKNSKDDEKDKNKNKGKKSRYLTDETENKPKFGTKKEHEDTKKKVRIFLDFLSNLLEKRRKL